MAVNQVSNKHLQISKANTVVVGTVVAAAVITSFSLVAVRSVLVKRAYQDRVITEKTKAVKQLEDNIEAVDKLKNSYQAFISQQENIIGGSSSGSGPKDGDNAKIILDALPSSYDFPAMATSLDKILKERSVSNGTISGRDDEVAQRAANSSPSLPVEMPFQMTASGSYATILDLINDLDISIRPIQLTSLTLSGNDDTIELSIDAKTFYQPGKTLTITKKVVE